MTQPDIVVPVALQYSHTDGPDPPIGKCAAGRL